MSYAWIITRNLDAEEENKQRPTGMPPVKSRVGTVGPKSASQRLIDLLKAGKGKRFRMLTDDEELIYMGRYLTDDDDDETTEFEPLDDFGAPNYGCTIIEYWNPKTRKWEML